MVLIYKENRERNNNKLTMFIPPLFIVLLVFSGRYEIPYIKELLPDGIYIGALFILILIIFLFVNKAVEIKRESLYYVILNFSLLIYIISRSFNKSTIQDVFLIIELSIYLGPLILFIFLFINKTGDNNKVIGSIFLVSLSLGFVALLTGGLGSGRLSALGGGSNVFGRYMVFGFTITLYYLFALKSKYQKMIMFFLLVMFIVLSIETGSRQAFLGVFLSIIVMLSFYILNNLKNRRLKIKNIFLISSLLFLTFYFIKDYLSNTIVWTRFTLIFESNKGDSINARLSMIEEAKQIFLDAPVFGKGTGAFKEAMNSIHTYPHNIIYELLSEYGLIGLILFLLIVLYVILKSLRLMIHSNINESKITMINLLLALFIVSIYFALISGYLYDSRWIWFYGTLIINYSMIKGDEQNEESKYVRLVRTI